MRNNPFRMALEKVIKRSQVDGNLHFLDEARLNETFLNQVTLRFSMTSNIGGSKRKARFKLTKSAREKGKISVSKFMQSFQAGQKVHLDIEPAIHKGDYSTDFVGKTGTVKAKRGHCYEVLIKDGNKEKMLIIHPVHLRLSRI